MASATDSRYGQKESSDQNFDYMFKILIIGNSSVGKTSFLFRYADDSFTPAFVSTVGIDFKVKTIYRNDKRISCRSGCVGLEGRCLPANPHKRKLRLAIGWRWDLRPASPSQYELPVFLSPEHPHSSSSIVWHRAFRQHPVHVC
uniref:small monomeric GTPase n=1 Tax=Mus musculus TaxID=10090 RepID=Q05D37_MOUSE|nr:Rab3a protein [Mus musculus]